jgi:hypothetical protein
VLIVILVLLVIVLVGPFLISIPPLEDTVPPEQLTDPDSRFVDVNGLQMHYKMAGQGAPTLVLLHGLGANVFSWREVMEPLAEFGTVIAFGCAFPRCVTSARSWCVTSTDGATG